MFRSATRYAAPAAGGLTRTQTDRQTDRAARSEVSSFRKKSYKSLSGEGERDTRTTHTVRQGRDMTEREGGHCCRVIQYSGYSVDFSSLGSKKTSVNYEEDDAAMPAILYTIQRSAKKLVRGCEKYVPALAYLFCLALPVSCLARFAYM